MQVIDSTHGTTSQGYTLTRTYHLQNPASTVVRVRIYRDFYAHQSYAVAETLTSGMEWNEIATELPANWHDGTPGRPREYRSVANHLAPIAETLVGRAAVIINAATVR